MPRGGMTASVRTERYESWVAAQSKNVTEAKLLAGRLRDLDRERAQSLHELNVEKRAVKKEHSKLLRERRTIVGRESPTSRSMTPSQPVDDVWLSRDKDSRMQIRVDDWLSSLSMRHSADSAAVGLPPIAECDETQQSNRPPKRPATRAMLESAEVSFDHMALSSNEDATQKPIEEDATSKVENAQKDVRRPNTRRRLARAEVERIVQSKMSRLKALSRVPAEFDLRAKEASVLRSGRPQLDMNFFGDTQQRGPTRPDPRNGKHKQNLNAHKTLTKVL